MEEVSIYALPGILYEDTELNQLQSAGLKPFEQLLENTRKREIAEDRQIYFYYLVKYFGWQLQDAGSLFNKDHATVIHSWRLIEMLRDSDAKMKAKLKIIERNIYLNNYGKMNYSYYFAIEKQLKNIGYDVDRKELIMQFTGGKKDSLRELRPHEYIKFIDYLKTRFNMNFKGVKKRDAIVKMRQKVYVLFVLKMGYSVANYESWMLQYSKFKKPIDAHTEHELTQLVTQAEAVYKSYLREIKKTNQINSKEY